MEDQAENPQIKYSWEAPLRPYIKRSNEVIRFYIAVTLLLSIIVALLGDPILLIPLWALLFIFYIFTVTPPQTVTNNITKFGIETAGATFRWEVLSYFYFTERFGYTVLVVVSHGPEFHHIYMVVPSDTVRQKIITLLSEHLVYQQQPVRTLTDRIVEAFSRLVPREDVEKGKQEAKHEQTVSQKHAQVSP